MAGISGYCEAASKLDGRTLGDAVDGFLHSVASVKRKDISEAVEEFIASRKPLTEAKAGKRPQLSKNYASEVGLWLRNYAKTFPSHAVCDLSKEHLNLFMRKHDTHSPRSRNHYRSAVKMFLNWCVKHDYLPTTHRLFEADSMGTEKPDLTEVEYYRPEELRAMLERARKKPDLKEPDFSGLVPAIALGGLAGLRVQEILRLEWSDVWRVSQHVEIRALKAKTRARRLIKMCSALAAWLEPYREFSGLVFPKHKDTFYKAYSELRDVVEISTRKNGLRHAFCTYHFALHANENDTAAQAGNSPAMIHSHYKGLATKDEGEKWFAVAPSKIEKIDLTI